MSRANESECWVVLVLMLSAAGAQGDGSWMFKDCWNDRTDAPQTELSDLGVGGFMAYARVADLDDALATKLARIQTRMRHPSVPENVFCGKRRFP